MTNFNISIVSDTVCPWCYVGKKRLEKGIAAFRAKHPDRNDTFSTTWLPYYLNPDAPLSVDKESYYISRFGEERSRAMYSRLGAVGEQEGISFKFGGKTGNTRDSHRLVQLGKTKGPEMQTKVISELFKAYFEQEEDITSKEVLLKLGVQAGLEEPEVEKMLASDKFGPEVDVEVDEAKKNFISGVPHFTINETFDLNGAQEPQAFVHLFERLLTMKSMA